MRNCMITGATSGIGRAIAYAFAANGDNLVVTGRREEKLLSLKEELERIFPISVLVSVFDVRDINAVKQACHHILEEYGHIDILINNAGLALGMESFQDYPLNDMLTMLDTNVRGLLTVTRELLPQMIRRNQGHIITIGSTAGLYAYAGGAVYAASKAAVKVLNDGIRIDTVDKQIKVTTLQPGLVETDFNLVRFRGDAKRAAQIYEGIDALQAEDIANCALFVANQPKHVQISDMTIMATQQATGFIVHRHSKEEGKDEKN